LFICNCAFWPTNQPETTPISVYHLQNSLLLSSHVSLLLPLRRWVRGRKGRARLRRCVVPAVQLLVFGNHVLIGVNGRLALAVRNQRAG
jgi:hypothetical protein